MLVNIVEQLHRSNEGKLRRFFMRRFRNREDAADATQETFLRMLTAEPKGGLVNPHAYLFQIAKTVAYGKTARLLRENALFTDESLGTFVADDAPDAERTVAARQELRLLVTAIAALPVRCKTVFVLSRIEGMSNGEIALQLHITRNMVEKHIMKALMHCRAARLTAIAGIA